MQFNIWGETYVFRSRKQKVVIVDYDGTLSDGKHRLHLLPTKDLHLTESWSEFNSASKYDEPITDTIAVINAMYEAGYAVIILTGRSDEVRSESIYWLQKYGVEYDHIIMRRSFDNRKDTVIKEEVLRAIGLENIVACWDDSPNVIKHMRGLGLTVYQVCDYGENIHNHLNSHGVDELKTKIEFECEHWFSVVDGKCLRCGVEELKNDSKAN